MKKNIKLTGVFTSEQLSEEENDREVDWYRLAALAGYAVYTKVKEHIKQKQEEKIIDITPDSEEISQN